MTLREFVGRFDFDYEIIKGDDGLYIALNDMQRANLGDIESDMFELSDDGAKMIIDRLDTYYQDYIFDDLIKFLNEKYNLKLDDSDWRGAYKAVKMFGETWDMDVLPYIFGDKELIIEELEGK